MIKYQPNISFRITKLSQFMVNPAAEHYHALPQIGSYIANMLDHGIITGAIHLEWIFKNNHSHKLMLTHTNFKITQH